MNLVIKNGTILTQGYWDLIDKWLKEKPGSYLEIENSCYNFIYTPHES